jgi:DNA-binding NtrC family response regulator
MMTSFHIVVAEDDPWYAELLQYHLSLNPDYRVEIVKSGKALLSKLTEKPDVVTLDYSLPDTSGSDLLKRIKSEYPNTHVVVVSGQEDIKTAVDLLQQGAYDYIVKDDDTQKRLWKTIANIRENKQLRTEVELLREEVGKKYDFSRSIIGESRAIKKIFGLLEKAAGSLINVSITGETGTGKEVIAKAIHYHSLRKGAPFVAINVAAIPAELIESELFGHEKGAFTGALTRRIGKFEQAGSGTIFLDEIGEMDLNMQTKLLRVLQEREFTRVGGNSAVKAECRIICATHRNLLEEVKKENFRQDLYFRLMGLPIELPPLRERQEDIVALSRFFLEETAKQNKCAAKRLSESAIKKLVRHTFPGNVRELKAVIDLAVVMSDDDLIQDDHILFHQLDAVADMNFTEMTLDDYNVKIVKYFLDKYDQNVLQVAKILNIGKSTIYRMLKEK